MVNIDKDNLQTRIKKSIKIISSLIIHELCEKHVNNLKLSAYNTFLFNLKHKYLNK